MTEYRNLVCMQAPDVVPFFSIDNILIIIIVLIMQLIPVRSQFSFQIRL